MAPIFNNKKVYLRRKSLRLQSRLFYVSVPLMIAAGVYIFYQRSPQNMKYVNSYIQSFNELSKRFKFYIQRFTSTPWMSNRSNQPSIPPQTQDVKKQPDNKIDKSNDQ